METNSLLSKEFYSKSLCIKHRAALKRFNEKLKETKLNTLPFLLQKKKLNHVMMVPSVAKCSFILLFCKHFSCSQLLSKVFALMINICSCWQMGWNGSPWVVWDGRKGKMLREAQRRGRKESARLNGWIEQ